MGRIGARLFAVSQCETLVMARHVLCAVQEPCRSAREAKVGHSGKTTPEWQAPCHIDRGVTICCYILSSGRVVLSNRTPSRQPLAPQHFTSIGMSP